MKPKELLRLVWINITQNKFKVVMTSIGIIVGAATIVMVIAIGKGGQADVADQFKNLNAGAVDISYDGGTDFGGGGSSDDSDSGMAMMAPGGGSGGGFGGGGNQSHRWCAGESGIAGCGADCTVPRRPCGTVGVSIFDCACVCGGNRNDLRILSGL